MHEETGIQIETSQLVGPFHRGTHTFAFAGVDYVSDSTFFAVRVDDVVTSFVGLKEAGSATLLMRSGGLPTN